MREKTCSADKSHESGDRRDKNQSYGVKQCTKERPKFAVISKKCGGIGKEKTS